MALALAMTDPHTTLLLRRHAAEQAVEDLINFLDDTEGDSDLEPAGDERDVSWPEGAIDLTASTHEDDEDTHDAEWLDENGGDILDEPHDALDEGNDEPSDDVGPYAAMTSKTKAAVAKECADLLGRLPQRHGPEFQAWLTGPDGSPYRFHRVA